jgi:hypothetical protein
MILGSVIEFQGHAGEHGMLSGQGCPGRQFLVIECGVGAIYQNLVRCTHCHLELSAYGSSVINPLAEALLDARDIEPRLFAIRTTYRFRHHNANGVDSNPDIWFASESKARDMFKRITREAAIKAWPVRDHQDVLNCAIVSVSVRRDHDWQEIEKREFKLS